MKTLPIYQVDAFASQVFGGNPAAVMPLEEWLPDDTMQKMALENHLSETAFLVPLPDNAEEDFHIRWFTPDIEVPLCGHATLASAWVLFNKLGWKKEQIRFQSKSGPLGVKQTDDGWLELDFPNLGFEERPTPGLPEHVVLCSQRHQLPHRPRKRSGGKNRAAGHPQAQRTWQSRCHHYGTRQ